jgi:tetratricopeptide (TPR) repeat protein
LSRADLFKAIASSRLAFHQDTLNPVVLGRLSQAYSQRGNRHAAGLYLRRATSISYARGLRALEAGDDTLASAAFQQTLQLLPEHPLALNRLADLALARADEQAALDLYTRSALSNPRFAETHIRLGNLHLARQELRPAQASFERAVELNINAFDAYLGLGEISLLEARWAEAADQFDKALLIRPSAAAAQAGLLRAHASM